MAVFLHNYDRVKHMALSIKQVQKLITIGLLWVSLPVFLLITNPEELPLAMLVVPFLLLFAMLYITARVALRIIFPSISTARLRLLAVLIGALPTLLLVLASIKQLTVRDTAIVVGLLVMLVFYLRRVDFLKI